MPGRKKRQRKRRGVSERTWLRAYRVDALGKQNGRCCFCMEPLRPRTATAEHMTPRARGGSTNGKNIAATCAPCNNLKAAMPEGEFRVLIRNPEKAVHRKIEFLMANARWRIFRRALLAERRILKVCGLRSKSGDG